MKEDLFCLHFKSGNTKQMQGKLSNLFPDYLYIIIFLMLWHQVAIIIFFNIIIYSPN